MWGDMASENPGGRSCLVAVGGAGRWAGVGNWPRWLRPKARSGRASRDEWINEVSAYEGLLHSLQEDGIPTPGTTQMNLESTV